MHAPVPRSPHHAGFCGGIRLHLRRPRGARRFGWAATRADRISTPLALSTMICVLLAGRWLSAVRMSRGIHRGTRHRSRRWSASTGRVPLRSLREGGGQGRTHHLRRGAGRIPDDPTSSGHLCGTLTANLGIRADLYTAVSGFLPLTVGENVDLVSRVRRGGARHIDTADSRVETSARTQPEELSAFGTQRSSRGHRETLLWRLPLRRTPRKRDATRRGASRFPTLDLGYHWTAMTTRRPCRIY